MTPKTKKSRHGPLQPMIARTWRGETTQEDAEKYQHYLQSSVLPELRAIPGFCGAYVLRKSSQGGFEFSVVTLWQSMESIRRFAGERPEEAVIPAPAKAVLIRYDETVSHYDVLASPERGE